MSRREIFLRRVVIYIVLITNEESLSEIVDGLLECNSSINDKWKTWCQKCCTEY